MFGQIRRMATKAAVRIPLTLHGIDGRYATALYTAAVKKNNLDIVSKELDALKTQLAAPKVKYFLETPTIDRAKKMEGVALISKKLSLSQTSSNLLEVLAENGRLEETEKVIESFQQLMTAHRNEVEVLVTTATALDAKSLQKVKDILTKKKIMGADKKLVISAKVNPEIVGGMIVEFAGKTVDMSVSSKITKLNSLLSEAI